MSVSTLLNVDLKDTKHLKSVSVFFCALCHSLIMALCEHVYITKLIVSEAFAVAHRISRGAKIHLLFPH